MPNFATATVQVRADTGKFKAEVESAAKSISDVRLNVLADTSAAKASLEDLAKPIEVKGAATLDETAAKAALEDVSKPFEVNGTATADTSAATVALNDLERPLTATVGTTADTGAALAALADLERPLTATVTAIADTSAARAALADLERPITVPVDTSGAGGGGSSSDGSSADGGGGGGGGLGAAALVRGGAGLVGAGAAAALVKSSLGGVAEVDRALGRISVNAQFAGGDISNVTADIESLKKKSAELGADPKYGKFQTSDFVLASEVLTKANLSIDDTKNLLEPIGNLAVASGQDIVMATQTVADFKAMLKVPPGSENIIVDTLANAEIAGRKGTIANYAQGLAYVGTQYAGMVDPAKKGVKASQELLGTFATMDNAGLRVEKLGTIYQSFLSDISGGGGNAAQNEITNLTESLQKQGKLVKGDGDIFFKRNGSMRDMVDIQKNLQAATEALNPLQRTQALNTIFQTDSQQLANTLISDHNNELGTTIEKMEKVGFAQKYAENNTKGLGGAMDALDGSFGSFKQTVGDLLKGPAETALRGMGTLLGDASTALQKIDFNGLKANIISALGGGEGKGLLDTLIPPDLQAKAATALAGLTAAFSSTFETIKEYLSLVDFGALLKNVQNVLSGVFAALSGAGEIISGIVDVFKGILHGKWGEVWNGLKEIFQGAWDILVGVVTKIIPGIIGVFDDLKKPLTDGLEKLFKSAVEGGWKAMQAAWDVVLGWIKGIPKMASDAASDLGNALKEAGGWLIEKAWKAAQAAWDTFTGWLGKIPGLATKAAAALGDALKEAGGWLVSKAWDAAKASWVTMVGWLDGLDDGAKKAAAGLATALVGFGKSMIDGAKNAAEAAWKSLAEWLKSLPGKVAELVKDVISALNPLNAAKGAFNFVAGNAEGAYVPNKMMSWLAEDGPEAVLPLTNPQRMRELLGDSRIASPILEALGAIRNPGMAADVVAMRNVSTPADMFSSGPAVVQHITVPTAEHALIYARANSADTYDRLQALGVLR